MVPISAKLMSSHVVDASAIKTREIEECVVRRMQNEMTPPIREGNNEEHIMKNMTCFSVGRATLMDSK